MSKITANQLLIPTEQELIGYKYYFTILDNLNHCNSTGFVNDLYKNQIYERISVNASSITVKNKSQGDSAQTVTVTINETNFTNYSIYMYLSHTSEEDKYMNILNCKNLKNIKGGSQKHKYKGRYYKIRTGSRGGKYIVVKGDKIYV